MAHGEEPTGANPVVLGQVGQTPKKPWCSSHGWKPSSTAAGSHSLAHAISSDIDERKA